MLPGLGGEWASQPLWYLRPQVTLPLPKLKSSHLMHTACDVCLTGADLVAEAEGQLTDEGNSVGPRAGRRCLPFCLHQ